MSNEVTVPAYKTKLGNSTAKSVLVLLADSSNTDGFSWPSIETIASRTELSVRQVLRLMQVFEEIGLVKRIKVRDQLYSQAFQINLDLLEKDLKEPFRQAFNEAQGKHVSETCVSATPPTVSETVKSVSETVKSVSETVPPHPLIGVTVIEPPMNRKAPRLPRKAVAVATTILPAWLDAETWAEFRGMRKRIGHPMTDYAEKLMLAKLERFEAKGVSSRELLERSIVNGWRDVFAPEQSNGNFRTAPASVKLVETEFKL